MADTFVKGGRWMRPPFIQTDVTFVACFLMDETFTYRIRLDVTFKECSSSMIPPFTI
jgi:hypothetical protein